MSLFRAQSSATPAGSAGRLALAVILIGAAVASFELRFLADDAFISFRYATRFASGRGLTWNDGEFVEGYSSWSWTVILGIASRLGLEPERLSVLLGPFLLLPATLLSIYLLSRTLWPSRSGLALGATLLCATNYTLLCFSTSGLETGLHLLLWQAALLVAARGIRDLGGGLSLFPLLAAAMVLTRPDSPLLLVVPAILVYRHGLRKGRLRAALVVTSLVSVVALAAWCAWKTACYGSLLPNTYLAKIATGPSMARGAYYLAVFSLCYGLIPLLPAVAASIMRSFPADRSTAAILVAPGALWALYVCRIGGDSMEFRLMSPVIPSAMILIALLASRLAAGWRAAVYSGVICLSLLHGLTFAGSLRSRGIGSVGLLDSQVAEPGSGWAAIGTRLAALFPDGDVTIATTAAGAIPYYSQLPSVDMLGLTDRWVALHGAKRGTRPGHQRMATIEYLRRRGANLVIGHPQVRETPPDTTTIPLDSLHPMFGYRPPPDPSSFPPGTRVLAIPLHGRYLMAIYLTGHPRVEEMIAGGVRSYVLVL